jgi:corrinoid protein of di/trimethylamine methyltransferase
MTHKERMLMAVRGEMPDVLPYAPRFDLWYSANSYTGTLPPQHRNRTADEIARAEGWALHKVIPELLKVRTPEDNVLRGLGLYSLKECGYRVRLSSNVEVQVHRSEGSTRVEYHTRVGTIRVTEVITEEMRRAGASITWIQERAIKSVQDYAILAYIFDNVEVVPDYESYAQWQAEIGGDGIATMYGSFCACPIQHIQRDFLEATDFFIEYRDHQKEMQRLAASIGRVYDQLLNVVAKSPADVVLWGANYDDMITYPPYFEKEITPWLLKAGELLRANGKAIICHCDGENLGLLDLIRDSGINIAEAVCPAPMTKVSIDEYYKRWGDKLTIFGGIPQSILLEETASEQDFKDYLDHFFKAVAPGTRIIVGIADTTPPNAIFDRLVRLGERIDKEGRLPLTKSFARHDEPAAAAAMETASTIVSEEAFRTVQQDVLDGNREAIIEHVQQLLAQGVSAHDILQKGMISAMEIIGVQFKTGDVFIPEVLLAARAMNEALRILEPHLSLGEFATRGKVVIGTVRGDLHDIGKNMVATMLRGAGLEIRDVGANVTPDAFVKAVLEHQPDVLALSALLTTTMPEMREVMAALTAAGLREKVKVVVGGAPVNDKYAHDIGADGYAADAGDAVVLVKGLLADRN